MLGTSYQKSVRLDRKHAKRMEAIYAKREDICRNCAFFKDGRFCVNPVHAEGNCWTDSKHVVGSIQVDATQGCELFEKRRVIEIREADPAEAEERAWYQRERRAQWDAQDNRTKEERAGLERAAQNRFGPIRNIGDMDIDALRRMSQGI